ncbi:Hypothetical protein CINCED_3A009525 [Cinara cedri]|uniref:Uncharacterized protein n=1 Tax=Cinara cedri TaxID=506608 RepID=A0A5E4MXF9_9HEMI|nr:Hypothetical protein CINCED_3A009525 [Cinara cedri]
MFKSIKEAALRDDLLFQSKTIEIDFEIGMIVAIKKLFGYQTEIKSGLFHFGQSIRRQIQKDHCTSISAYLTDDCWETIRGEAPMNESKLLKMS